MRLQLIEQSRQGELHGIPKDVAVDIELRMHEAVTHADDLWPMNACQFCTACLAYLASGFADDLDGTC